MKPSAALVQLIERDPSAYAISGEGASRFVAERRAEGGCLPLIVNVILLLLLLASVTAALSSPLAWFAVPLFAGPLALTLWRGLQTRDVSRSLAAISRLRLPSAALVERVLVVGEAGTPVDTWHAVPVTAAEERQIRGLALPAARVIPP